MNKLFEFTAVGVMRASVTTILAAVVTGISISAWAAPITTDLAITGSVELSTAFSDGNVIQIGEIRETEGTVLSSEAFTTAPGTVDFVDDGTSGPATNPLMAAITETGDGFGASTNLDGSFEIDDYAFITDIVFDLENTSLVDTYQITFEVDYSGTVEAGAFDDVDDFDDDFAQLQLDVELDNVDQVTSDIVSDSFFGDELNGVATGNFGDAVSDSGIFTFDVVLIPEAVSQVTAMWNWEGGVFFDSATAQSLVDGVLDITITDVACITSGGCGGGQPPPTGVPEPGTLALLASALVLLGFRRRHLLR